MTTIADRVEQALAEIAGEAPLRDTLATARAKLDHQLAAEPTASSRRTPWLAVAAAGVVTAGIGGLWLSQGGDSRPSATTALAPDPSGPDVTAAFPEPSEVAILDPALRLGAPSRSDPIADWLDEGRNYGGEAGRVFVRHGDGGDAVSSLSISSMPRGVGESLLEQGDQVDIDGIEARSTSYEGFEAVAWAFGDEVRVVYGRGAATIDDAVALAQRWGSGLAGDVDVPSEFTEVAIGRSYGTVSYPSGLYTTLHRSGDDLPLDAASMALLWTDSPVPEGENAWHTGFPPDGTSSRFVFVQLDTHTVVRIQALQSAVDLRDLDDSVQIVAADEIDVLGTPMIPGNAEIEAFGEVTWGRWVLRTWGEGGGECSHFSTSFAGGSGSCPRTDGPASCWFVSSSNEVDGNAFLIAVDHDVDRLDLGFDDDEPRELEIARSEGFTFGFLRIPGAALTVERSAIFVDGVETVC